MIMSIRATKGILSKEVMLLGPLVVSGIMTPKLSLGESMNSLNMKEEEKLFSHSQVGDDLKIVYLFWVLFVFCGKFGSIRLGWDNANIFCGGGYIILF